MILVQYVNGHHQILVIYCNHNRGTKPRHIKSANKKSIGKSRKFGEEEKSMPKAASTRKELAVGM